MDTDDEQILSLLVESFLLSGRVTNVTCLIAFHPQYLEGFLRTEYFMFKGEGPLPFDWRCLHCYYGERIFLNISGVFGNLFLWSLFLW